MSKKKVHHEEHVDETWLIPYADMLTLLLALFIVMFAMSQLDNAKFQKVSEQFNIIFSGGSGVLEKEGTSLIPMEDLPSLNKQEDDIMEQIKEDIEKEIKGNGYSDKVSVTLNDEGLGISIQDVVLFNSGKADVLPGVHAMLLHVSDIVKGLDNDIKVVGHTDDIPINTPQFRSNWDLSAIRAINVMNFFIDNGGLNPERFSIQGFGQYSPKYDNSTVEGKAKNRRVEIVVIRKYPLEQDEK
ncbi:motility protein B [Ruminiclostridium hungatei]|uniref:Motility protein B n=1 Tax=Ruminiclostridium hungatei TaxID=48256 RepID=A0A1V4SLM6_RUMHU|nr:flagellar motor protein MotB [Ruminiclostridium hungatei]OPX44131.1 motility protein B [Ruminiclostridium hungatei]